MSLAVVVIASDKRRESTFPRVLDSVRDQAPDEIVVVADFPCEAKGVRCLRVAPMLRNTVDALVKRDVGWLATASDSVCFLCDDHMLHPEFVRAYRECYGHTSWNVLVPSRYCVRDGERIWLNVGRDHGYAGGHAAIYRRECAYLMPWAATLHHPNWDVIHSHQLVYLGCNIVFADPDLAVEDIEGGTPWL